MMPPKTKKAQKKKETAEVLLTIGASLEEAHLGPCEIWFKYGVAKTRIFFEGIVNVMRREIKKELSSLLDDVAQHIIENTAIEELKHEIKHEVNDTIKKVIAQQKSADKVSVSNLSEMRMREILNSIGIIKEDFEKLILISYPTFEWSEETEAQQMDEVVKCANILLTGGGDIAIGPSRTDRVWISVDRGLALAIIKQFVIEEGNRLNEWIGKSATYVSGDAIEPFRKKAKLSEHMIEEIDERMELIIDDMSEEELSKMKAREKLRIVRKFCKLDEQPYIDQIIMIIMSIS
ncbi:hypothetical protein F8M41_025120 [Gigaspora margarita]|uniref:Uncharacterized protein n=1 Tax=Gigaspora margarita TaxID=4874 RepID=A0A8H3XLB5_GIGMA|nr:hypothetical protein F8M41_025120 [Gigaspora margarita]